MGNGELGSRPQAGFLAPGAEQAAAVGEAAKAGTWLINRIGKQPVAAFGGEFVPRLSQAIA
jgi:hypothetical protein